MAAPNGVMLIACAIAYLAIFGIIWGLTIPAALLCFVAGAWFGLQAIGNEIIVEHKQRKILLQKRSPIKQQLLRVNSSFYHHHPLVNDDDVDDDDDDEWRKTLSVKKKKFVWGQAQDTPNVPAGKKFDRRLTGSNIIDTEINTTIDLALKLYVTPWFSELFQPYSLTTGGCDPADWLTNNNDDVVIHELRVSINKMLITLANPCKDADFAQYLTTTVVNDFATHLRIFKRAKEFAPFRPPTTHTARDPYSTVLVANFFKAEPRTPPVVSIGTKPSNNESPQPTTVCRENVACNRDSLREYLLLISDMLFYLLADRVDFNCALHRHLFNDIFTTTILLPTVHVLSQPDTINKILLWLLQDVECDTDAFLVVIRSPETTRDELLAIREQVEHEMDVHRARDSSTDAAVKEALKAQLQSLDYLQRLIDRKIYLMSHSNKSTKHAASEGRHSRAESTAGDSATGAMTPIQHMGLQDILGNNIALSYFIDFLQSHHDTHHLLFFYLTIEGFRNSTISDAADNNNDASGGTARRTSGSNTKQLLIRDTAISIFDQYLSDKATHALALFLPQIIRSGEIRRLWARIINTTTNESSGSGAAAPPDTRMFDNLQQKVYVKLNDDYFPAFRASHQYWQMLGELDLLRGSSSMLGDTKIIADKSSNEMSSKINAAEVAAVAASSEESHQQNAAWNVFAEILSAIVAVDKRRSNTKYAAYKISVKHGNSSSNNTSAAGVAAANPQQQRTWECWRRYSEFRDLHIRIQRQFPNLQGLSFPAKEMNNLRADVMERRKRTLGLYLHTLLYAEVLNSHEGLLNIMLVFLAPGEYNPVLFSKNTPLPSNNPVQQQQTHHVVENSPVLTAAAAARRRRQNNNSTMAATSVLADSAQSVKKNVKLLGENVLQMSTNMLANPLLNSLAGKFHLSSSSSSTGAGGGSASFHIMPFNTNSSGSRTSDAAAAAAEEREVMQNIPLRILLLLMDEVFDLKNRNQWLRNRIISMLTTLVRATLGDSMNKKIVQFVDYLLSPEQLASYIKNLRESFLVPPPPPTSSENDNGSQAANESVANRNVANGTSVTSTTSSSSGGSAAFNNKKPANGSGDAVRQPRRSVSESSDVIAADTDAEGKPKHVSAENVFAVVDTTTTKMPLHTTATRSSRSQFYTLQHQRSASSSSHQQNQTDNQIRDSRADHNDSESDNRRRRRREKSADSAPAVNLRTVASVKNDHSVSPVTTTSISATGSNMEEKLRCQIKVLVKAKMLSLMMSQFQSILGTRTVQMGTFTLFDLLQYPVLNTRLLTILIEGCLQVIFQHNGKQIAQRFQEFHNGQ